jgi:hypothetical protein
MPDASCAYVFEVRVAAAGPPPDGRGVHPDADEALHLAVEEFKGEIRARGFMVVRTGSGVRRLEVPDA